MRHRHKWERGSGKDDAYRVCHECRAVQKMKSGRWIGGAQASNPTEQKNVARRVLGD